jgi:hypothetical protein
MERYTNSSSIASSVVAVSEIRKSMTLKQKNLKELSLDLVLWTTSPQTWAAFETKDYAIEYLCIITKHVDAGALGVETA